ncbi:MAG: hypothetical protein QNJ37_12340 [Crocosphaera sp.]|nr:hypothetical protein [Crocosphaera sp.]
MLITDEKIQKFYNNIVNNLSPNEQLLLDSLILNDLSKTNVMIIDDSDTWTEENQNDLITFSLNNNNEVLTDSSDFLSLV